MAKLGFIVTAGGIGQRMGYELPKQFIKLCGKPILVHTLERISKAYPECQIVVVLPEQWIKTWREICQQYDCIVPHTIVTGGTERFHSVKNGINALSDVKYIAIHDGVRPIISSNLIESLVNAVELHGSSVPAIKPVDSMRKIYESGENQPINRNEYVMIQTPQVFRSDWLRHAYNCDYSAQFTDDASVVEAAGYKITIVQGDRRNIKITTNEDLLIAETFINSEKTK